MDQDLLFLPDQPQYTENMYEEKRRYDYATNLKVDAMENNYNDASKYDPAKESEKVRLIRTTNQPAPFIEKNQDEVKRYMQAPSREYWSWYTQYNPKATDFLSDPVNMLTAYDLHQELSHHENMFSLFAKGHQVGMLQNEKAELGFSQLLQTILSGQRSYRGETRLQEIDKEIAQESAGVNQSWAPTYHFGTQIPNWYTMAKKGGVGAAIGGTIGGLLALAAGNLGPQAAVPEETVTVPAAVVTGIKVGGKLGGKLGVLQASLMLEAGSAYRDYVSMMDQSGKPVDPKKAAQAALVVGAVNAGIEYAQLKTLLEAVPGGKKLLAGLGEKEALQLVKEFTLKKAMTQGVKTYLKTIAEESGQEFAQEFVSQSGGQIVQGKYNLGDVVGNAAQVISPTAQATAINPLAILGMGSHIYEGLKNVESATASKEFYAQVGEEGTKSEYAKRIPEKFGEFIKSNVEGGPVENVFVDTEALVNFFQNQVPNVPVEQSLRVVANELGINDQMEEAIQTGKPLQIPYSTWIEKTVQTPLYQAMQDHVKFTEDGLTYSQVSALDQIIQTSMTDEQAKAQQIIEQNAQMQDGYDEVYNDMKNKLEAAGKPRKIKSDKEFAVYVDRHAKIWAAHAVAEASRRGETVQEVYQKIAPQIQVEGNGKINNVAGDAAQSFNQINAWHGSPNDFDQFVTSHIGEGQGMGNYGWGLYFTDKKEIANWYKERAGEGKLYEVNLNPDQTDMIEWDKPFAEQSPKVQQALLNIIGNETTSAKEFAQWLEQQHPEIAKQGWNNITPRQRNATQFEFYKQTGKSPWIGSIEGQNGELVYKVLADKLGGARRASEYLDMNGIPGIVYKDAISKGVDKNANNYVIFNGSDVDVINKYNQDQTNPRAQVSITPKGSLVTLFAKADASSFLHESAHIFLNDMFEYIGEGKADEKYLKDWSVISDWLELKEGQEKLTTEQQEKFARGFEAYLMEGKAPSRGLEKVFASFRRWLVKIYRDISGLDVDMSDEVRSVMDRLVATEDEIQEREAYNGYYEDVLQGLNVSESTRAKLDELRMAAHEKAISMLNGKQMEELKPESKEFRDQEKERIRREVEADTAELPIYKIMEVVRQAFGLKKNPVDVAQKYVNGELTNTGRANGVWRFDVIAEENGYSSGDELAQAILRAKPYRQEVEDTLEMRLSDQPMDLRDTMAFKKEAEEAVHNDERLDVLAMEKSILRDMVQEEESNSNGRRIALDRARAAAQFARKNAKAILEGKPYREASAATSYFAAERKAAIMETHAIDRKDFEAAHRYADQRLLNHALALEAMNIKKESEKLNKYLDAQATKKKDLFKKEEHFVQVASILDRIGIIRPDFNSADKKESLAGWVKKMDDGVNVVNIADWLLDESQEIDRQDLTIEELRDVTNAIKNITQIANFENRTLEAWGKANISDIADRLRIVADENINNKPKVKLTLKETGVDKILNFKETAKFNLLNVETILRKLDGYKSLGDWWQTFYGMFDKASNSEAAMLEEATNKYKEILSVYSEKERREMANKSIFIPEIKTSLTKNEILAMALNWGNEGNKDKLLGGYGWDELTIKGMLERMLDKRDWGFVQNTWNFNNSFWPEISKLHEELTGFVPEKVEALPFDVTTSDGTLLSLDGGYYPLVRDPRFNVNAAENMALDKALYEGGVPTIVAATKKGHTIARVDATYQVSLNMDLVQRHVFNVIHDLSHRKAVIDANRMLGNKNLQSTIIENLGMEGMKALKDWVRTAAGQMNQPPLTFFDKMARGLRKRTVIAGLAFRIGAMFQNMINFTSAVGAMNEFGYGNVAKAVFANGITNYYSKSIFNPKGAKEIENFIFEKSQFMKDRSGTFDRDIREMTSKAFGKENKFQEFAMAGYSYFDKLVNIPLWMESYRIALNEYGGNEEKAIQFADSLVRRTAGSGRVIDTASFMRGGELQKLFTVFYSFMNTQLNLMYEAGDQFVLNKNVPKFMGRMLALWIIPSTLGTLMAFKGPSDDDDKLKWWLKQIAAYPCQMIPGIRDIIGPVMDGALGDKSFGYRMTPVQSAPEAIVNFAKSANSFATGESDLEQFAEKTGKAASYLAPYPDQINAWTFNVIDYLNGDMNPELKDVIRRRPKDERVIE